MTVPLGNAGGLIGFSIGTSVLSSYATGDVKGSNIVGQENNATYVGGLIGHMESESGQTVQNSFARGNATGGTKVGGLIGGIVGLGGGDALRD